MENHESQLDEIYRLTRENNRMLHAMRRNAFLGTLFKLLVYGGIALLSFWAYLQYINPMLEQLLKTMQQMQGTGTQAQVQLQGLQDALKSVQSYIPSLPKSQ